MKTKVTKAFRKAILILSTILFVLIFTCFMIMLLNVFIFGLKNFSLSSFDFKSFIKICSYTLLQSILSTLISLILGFCAAYYISLKKVRFLKFVDFFSAVPLCISAVIICLAYINIFGINGLFNKLLVNILHIRKAPFTFLYSFFGVIFIQGFYNFPLVTKNVCNAIDNKSFIQEDAARILGAGEAKIFFKITLPSLTSSIINSLIPIFIFCYFSFIIVLMFASVGNTTLEVSVFQFSRKPSTFNLASFYALTESVIALLLFYILNKIDKKYDSNKDFYLEERKEKTFYTSPLKFIDYVFITLFILLFIFCFLLPLISIPVNSYNIKTVTSIFRSSGFYTCLLNTILLGAVTSFLTTLLSMTFCVFSRIKKIKLSRLVSILPMCVSSIIIGFAIIFTVRKGNVFYLILCQSLLLFPFSARILFPPLQKISDEIINSSLLLSGSYTETIFRVIIPYCKKGILTSLGLCFALSAGEASLPLVLSIRNFEVLSQYIYRLASNYRLSQANLCAFILMIICCAFYSVANDSFKTFGKGEIK